MIERQASLGRREAQLTGDAAGPFQHLRGAEAKLATRIRACHPRVHAAGAPQGAKGCEWVRSPCRGVCSRACLCGGSAEPVVLLSGVEPHSNSAQSARGPSTGGWDSASYHTTGRCRRFGPWPGEVRPWHAQSTFGVDFGSTCALFPRWRRHSHRLGARLPLCFRSLLPVLRLARAGNSHGSFARRMRVCRPVR